MPKVQINAELITCQVDITAKAGEQLLLYAGYCLGVFHVPPPEIELRTASGTLWVEPMPQSKSNGLDITEKEILAVLANGAMNVFRISDALHIDRKDRYTRGKVGQTVRQLASAKKLKKLPGTIKNHFYEIR